MQISLTPIVCEKDEVTKFIDDFAKEANVDPIIVRAVGFCLFAAKVVNFVKTRDELAPVLVDAE